LALCAELAAALPARNLLIVNGNGGNRGILEALLYEIGRDHGFNACVTHPTALSTVKSGSPLPEVHGGMSETSVMMALAPDVVHMELIPDTYAPESISPDAVRHLVLDRGTTWPWSSDDHAIASHGIIGHALRADVETGQRIVESAVEGYGRVLAELRGRYRAGE
jgi:creatinine amidohydrolase/Fe(II)-dependent formamide hydrolase-like protein